MSAPVTQKDIARLERRLIAALGPKEPAPARMSPDVETTTPLEIVKRTLDGTHPLRAWREYRGMTQDALSEASGVPKMQISRFENFATPSVPNLQRLADALNTIMDNLVPTLDDEDGDT